MGFASVVGFRVLHKMIVVCRIFFMGLATCAYFPVLVKKKEQYAQDTEKKLNGDVDLVSTRSEIGIIL